MEPKNRSVAEGGRTDELPQDRLWFLEGMDRVNQAIQDTEDLQQTIHVLDAMLSIFGGDRAHEQVANCLEREGAQLHERLDSEVAEQRARQHQHRCDGCRDSESDSERGHGLLRVHADPDELGAVPAQLYRPNCLVLNVRSG